MARWGAAGGSVPHAVLAAVCALVLLAAATPASAAELEGSAEKPGPSAIAPTADARFADRYLVRFAAGTDPVAEAAGATRAGGSVRHVYRHVFPGLSLELPARAVSALQRNPRVLSIEHDGEVSISAGSASSVAGVEPVDVLDAASQGEQPGPPWGLDRSDQRALPLSGSYTYPHTGAGVTAYIVDTGIRSTHTDFGDRVGSGYTAINDGLGTDDCNGHGTHVAGTVGGTTYGMAKGVSLIPVRVLDCEGSGTWEGVIAGLDWIVGHHTPDTSAVANASLGGWGSASVDAAVQAVIDAGVTFVAAAGNDDLDACFTSPARVSDAVTVGATDAADARAWFSNFGSCLDLFAPGVAIPSAWHTGDDAARSISGTSMAAPHVAGAVAVMLGELGSLLPTEVEGRLMGVATPGVVTDPMASPNLLLYSPPVGYPLTLVKSADPSPVEAGGQVSYTLEATNDSAASLPAVVITDAVPGNTTYVPDSADCDGTFADGVVTFALGALAADESRTCSFAVTVAGSPHSSVLFRDDFDGDVGAAGWSTSHDTGTSVTWELTSSSPHSSPNAMFAPNVATVSDQRLAMASPVPITDGAQLRFMHRYDIELGYDGGVIEASTDGGASWSDLGPHIAQNGYDLRLSNGYSNPLGGRHAFSGDSGGYVETLVDLGSFSGEDLQVRFRLGTDSEIGAVGWWVDDVEISQPVAVSNTASVSDSGGEAVHSNTVDTLVMAPTAANVPGEPTEVSAAASGSSSESSSASVVFTAPLSDGGAEISSYEAECASSDGGVTRTGSGASSPIAVDGLTAAATYWCRVRAVNAVGAGPYSEPSAAFVMPPPPDTTAPVWPSGASLDAAEVAQTSVSLTWPAASDDSGIAEYRLFRDGVLLDTTGPGTRSLTDTGLEPGTVYGYAVRAVDGSPNANVSAPLAREVTTTAASEPDSTDPDSTDPDSTEPDSTEPDSTEPDSTEPDSTEPDSTDPDSTEPDSTDPDPTDQDPADGDPTDADPADGDPTEADPTDGDPVDGWGSGSDRRCGMGIRPMRIRMGIRPTSSRACRRSGCLAASGLRQRSPSRRPRSVRACRSSTSRRSSTSPTRSQVVRSRLGRAAPCCSCPPMASPR
jgi:uncharacterized repeat protein (TIGR01451 family)